MDIPSSQPEQPRALDLSAPSKGVSREVISLDECKQFMGTLELSDEKILEIRNSMVGMVDRIMNAYLKHFE